jgi:undecaprenyl pyrophosphate synthase
MSSKEKCMQYHKPEMLLRGQYLLEEASLVIRTWWLSRTSGLMWLTSGNAHREFEETNFPWFSPDVYKAVIDRYKKKMITWGINNGA